MKEEILKILSMVKNEKITEEEAEELLSAMFEPIETEEKQTTVIRNYLPWSDDGKLRIVAFKGHEKLKSEEAYNEYKMEIEISGDILGIAECCGNLKCEDVHGDVSCGASIECGDVYGSINAGNSVSCGSVTGGIINAGREVNCGAVDGNVNAGSSVKCFDVSGNANAGGTVECGDVSGNVKADTIKCTAINGVVECDSKFIYDGNDLTDEIKNLIKTTKVIPPIPEIDIPPIPPIPPIDFDVEKIDLSKDEIWSQIEQARNQVVQARDQYEQARRAFEADIESTYSKIPWDDNNDLHIAAFIGRKLIKDEIAFKDYQFNIQLDNDVKGNVYSCGNIQCSSIGCDANAGTHIVCNGNIGCDANAGTHIECNGDIGCDANAGTHIVLCNGDIGCDANSGNYIECGGDIGGDAKAENGSITCNDIEGDAYAKTINRA